MKQFDELVDEYYSWLREETIVEEGLDDWFCIDTPFLGAFNDHIEIYAKHENNKITLSDNGETLQNLELQGVNMNNSPIRRDILSTILLQFGVQKAGDELTVVADVATFAQKKHNFLLALLEINDLAVLSKHSISSIFKDDVRNFLDEQGITYTPEFISKGMTGLEFTFDFQIAQQKSEVVLKSFNSINKSTLSTFLFSWEDVKPNRERITKKEVKAVAILNDTDKAVRPEYIEALISKQADVVLWSERKESPILTNIAA
jgi:hypothetical protein